jgi:hypothetical protein
MHQLFPFLDLGLVVTELSRDDLYSAGDPVLQAGLQRYLATAGPFDAGEVSDSLGTLEGWPGSEAAVLGSDATVSVGRSCVQMKRKTRVSMER